MDIKDRELYAEFSSYEEILDFEAVSVDDEEKAEKIDLHEVPFYRSIDEY